MSDLQRLFKDPVFLQLMESFAAGLAAEHERLALNAVRMKDFQEAHAQVTTAEAFRNMTSKLKESIVNGK